MAFRIIVVRDAKAQIADESRWWRDHGGNVGRLKEAIHRAVKVIAEFPGAGTAAKHIELGVRMYPLRGTKYVIYYRVDSAKRSVRILAFWHTSRGTGPPLPF